jgi:hypothetical protein
VNKLYIHSSIAFFVIIVAVLIITGCMTTKSDEREYNSRNIPSIELNGDARAEVNNETTINIYIRLCSCLVDRQCA